MSASVRDVCAHLGEAAGGGTLAELCERHDLDRVVVLGSVLVRGRLT